MIYGKDTYIIPLYLRPAIFCESDTIMMGSDSAYTLSYIGIHLSFLCAHPAQYKKAACISHYREYRNHPHRIWIIHVGVVF